MWGSVNGVPSYINPPPLYTVLYDTRHRVGYLFNEDSSENSHCFVHYEDIHLSIPYYHNY